MNKSVNESAEDIFKVIRETVKEHVKINVEYDDEMNVFFFRIMSTYDTFHKNFEVLDKLDEIFKHTLYKDKKIVVTLEEK